MDLISTSKVEYLPTLLSRQPNSIKIKLKTLTPHAKIPTRSTPGAIVYDVFSTHTAIIQPGEIKPIPTGIATALPAHTYIRIAEPSSWALNHNISVGGGKIDPDF